MDGHGMRCLLPFSCKGHCFCLSCESRLVTKHVAHLVEAELRRILARQSVPTLPYRLPYSLARDHECGRRLDDRR